MPFKTRSFTIAACEALLGAIGATRMSIFQSESEPEIDIDFQGAVGRVENLSLVFHSFHGPGISTALFLPGSIRHRTVHLGPRDFASNASLAFCIACAASVSLLRMACC